MSQGCHTPTEQEQTSFCEEGGEGPPSRAPPGKRGPRLPGFPAQQVTDIGQHHVAPAERG